MKILKYIFFLFMPLLFLGGALLTSCNLGEEEVGEPVIYYIRVTDPAKSDSLLVGAFLNNLVAIVGDNLSNTRELYFNDRKAILNPAYVTKTTILVNVPELPPVEVTNKIYLNFKNGKSLAHDFSIEIPAPEISSIVNEYAKIGEVAELKGNFFYEPLTVTFAGGVVGEVVSVTQNEVKVTVPQGAERGTVQVETNFGKATSNGHMFDNRNIFASLDGGTAGYWHGHTMIVESDPDIPNINGKFLRVKNNYGGGWWEFLVAPANSDIRFETRNIPADAISNPSAYNLKFEINTQKPILDGTSVRMYIGNDMPAERNNTHYVWKPAIDTKGEWQTITIPFEAIKGALPNWTINPDGYGISFWFWDGVAMEADFALDNFRVVPK